MTIDYFSYVFIRRTLLKKKIDELLQLTIATKTNFSSLLASPISVAKEVFRVCVKGISAKLLVSIHCKSLLRVDFSVKNKINKHKVKKVL